MEKIFKSKVAPVINKPVMKVICAIPGVNQLIFKKIRNTLLEAFGGRIREIVMGGAALNPDVEKWFRKFKLQGRAHPNAMPLINDLLRFMLPEEQEADSLWMSLGVAFLESFTPITPRNEN